MLMLLLLLLTPANTAADTNNNNTTISIKEMEEDAILVGQAAMNYIASISDEAMRKWPTDMLHTVRYDLQRIFDRLVSVRRDQTYLFYASFLPNPCPFVSLDGNNSRN